jgi:hypothetical protein
MEIFLTTESMVLKHSAKIYWDLPSIDKLTIDKSPFHQARFTPFYSVHSLLMSAISVPFYYAALIFSVYPADVVGLFVYSLVISLISVVVFCFSLALYRSKKIAFASSLILGVCSFILPYNTSLEPNALQALCIITSAYFIYLSVRIDSNRNHSNIANNYINNRQKTCYFYAGLAGLFIGLSIFAHPTSIIVVPGFVGYVFFSTWRSSKKNNLICFLLALGIIILFAGLVNYWRFGSFTDFGYGYHQSLAFHGGWKGLGGLLASPGVGIVLYFPLVILLPIALKYMYRENKGIVYLTVFIILVCWLFFGTIHVPDSPADLSYYWWGVGWGPRYLIPLLPFIAIVLGALLYVKNRLVLEIPLIILCILGFSVNFLGKLVWYQYAYGYGWSIEGLSKYDQTFPQTHINSYDVMTWNLYYSPIILSLKVLTSDFVSKIPNEFIANGLAPCSYDIYIFCKFGIIPMLLLSGVIVILAFLILREISTRSYLKNDDINRTR